MRLKILIVILIFNSVLSIRQFKDQIKFSEGGNKKPLLSTSKENQMINTFNQHSIPNEILTQKHTEDEYKSEDITIVQSVWFREDARHAREHTRQTWPHGTEAGNPPGIHQ